MFQIRHVSNADKSDWFLLDALIRERELDLKIRDKRGFVISDDGTIVGVLRYNLFWDTIPCITHFHFDESSRGKGFGTQALLHWESEMRELGYTMVMTTTQSDEQAQRFYRKFGYKDKGCLCLDGTPFAQPQEILMLKIL